MKILLGMTGSVASVLYKKLAEQLQSVGDVEVIVTDKALPFIDTGELRTVTRPKHLKGEPHQTVWSDLDEWKWPIEPKNHFVTKTHWEKNDRVLHIELRDKASALVIAPCSANTLAKLANGLCDNLLTSVARAWDLNRPIIIAPAMNTNMWEHPITQEHIQKLKSWGYIIVEPQSKMLACKTEGMGAMADIGKIVETVKESLRWKFPCRMSYHSNTTTCLGIPDVGHPGAFLTKRKYSTHTGVDLYVPKNSPVFAVESGKIVCIEQFTGINENTPWWLDTDCVLVEGATGVVCYGEIEPARLQVGQNIKKGTFLGYVIPVLPDEKFRPDIDGHSVSMLHMELYPHGRYTPSDGYEKDKGDLRDPTPFLVNAINAPTKRFKV